MKTTLTVLILLVSLAGFSGCHAVGRWLAPIDVTELSAAAQTKIAALEAAKQKETSILQAEIAKLKASKPTSLWPMYVGGVIAIIGGPVVGYFLGKVILGVLLVVGGASSIAWAQFLERYPWAMWIPFGVVCALGLYWLWDWYNGVKAQKVAEAVVPAIEEMGEGPQQLALKAKIKEKAKKYSGLVKSEVSAVKAKLGL